jgi:hypothetical protein
VKTGQLDANMDAHRDTNMDTHRNTHMDAHMDAHLDTNISILHSLFHLSPYTLGGGFVVAGITLSPLSFPPSIFSPSTLIVYSGVVSRCSMRSQ